MASYFYDCLSTLIDQTEVKEILVVAYAPLPVAPYNFPEHSSIRIIYFENYSKHELGEIATSFSPDIVYISGWFNMYYLKLGRRFRERGIPVVMGLDNQWTGSFRQRLGKFFFPLFYRHASSHIWVAGLYQYEFARRLGYKKNQILLNLYSANVPAFSRNLNEVFKQKQITYPKIILFIGRFVPEKGIDLLIETFSSLKKEEMSDWELWLIGNGPLKDKISKSDSIKVIDFIQPSQLPELMTKCGLFCLPSTYENWGVVIHEAAAVGLPIITSNACGAATAFVKHNYNGFVFESGNKKSLHKYLKKAMQSSDESLVKMGHRSSELAQQITPQIWAATFVSILE